MVGAHWEERIESGKGVRNGRSPLGKRSLDGGLREEETRGRVSPIEGQASSRSDIGESCARKGLAGERGRQRESRPSEICQGRCRSEGRELGMASLGNGALAGPTEGAMPGEGLAGDVEGKSALEADG
jgi:hypothetical protein